MNNNKRLLIAAGIAAVLVISPLFLIRPITGLMIAAAVFALLAVAAVAGVFYWASNRAGGMFVTTAALMLIVAKYAFRNVSASVIVLALQLLKICNMPVGWFIFLQLIIAATAAWQLLAADAGKEEIERVETKIKEQTFDWKMLRIEFDGIVSRADDEFKSCLKEVQEAVRYADPMSSAKLEEIESMIKNQVKSLAQAVADHDKQQTESLCREIIISVKQRAEMCKLLK